MTIICASCEKLIAEVAALREQVGREAHAAAGEHARAEHLVGHGPASAEVEDSR